MIADKWHTNKKSKPEVKALIAKTSEEHDYIKREEVFKNNRDDLTVEFR